MAAETLYDILESGLRVYAYSGYQLYSEKIGSEPVVLAGGTTGYWPGAEPVTDSTWFDIGSVTKAVVTTSLVARLVEQKKLSLDATIGAHVPKLAGSPYASIRVDDLLTHTAGLAGWLPLFRETSAGGLLDWFLANSQRAIVRKKNEATEYSDLGFLLLGKIVEAVAGPLAEAFEREVAKPLGVSEVEYGPRLGGNIAMTEYCLHRGRMLQGEVFDENCAALGHVGSHAGLFATARGLAPWARGWLDASLGQSTWLSRATADTFRKKANVTPGSTWARGWDTRSPEKSSAGRLFSLSAFGHLGYPGCSAWIDPDASGFALLFTNRVHPSRFDERVRGLRPRIHDAIASSWRP